MAREKSLRRANSEAVPPTKERLAQIATEIELIRASAKAGRDKASEAWRVVPVAQLMRKRGQIGEAEERAAEMLMRDFVIGFRTGGLVSRYDGLGHNGGPALDDDPERLSPEDRRAFHHNRFLRALKFLNHQTTALWLVRIVCEQTLPDEPRVPSLKDAGAAYMRYQQPQQAQAAGATLLKSGLERLAAFYGLS